MTVFVAHAPADREAAEELEKFLERRGQFVELDDGQTALLPVTPSDVVVLILSKDFEFAPARLRLEQRALDAWSDGRLLLVRLDQALAPVGLRDLPAIDASDNAEHESKWQELAAAIRQKLQGPPARDNVTEGAPSAAKKRGGLWRVLLGFVLALPGIGALVALAAIWLVNRIGPRPGGWVELRAGVDQFGVRYGLPAGVTVWIFAIAILTLIVVVASVFTSLVRKRARRAAKDGATFVSYARANEAVVMPMLEVARGAGRAFWIDERGVVAGDKWAGDIARAIGAAGEVMVMCSAAAFESDRVKREVYLADRYSKKLIPIFLEHTVLPEDFEYFFAGVQGVRLFETPEAERPSAVLAALGVH